MQKMRLRGMRLAVFTCGFQLLLGVVFAVVFGLLFGARTAAAAMVGAVIAVVPGLYMALHLLPGRSTYDARQQARLLMLGQFGKLILTGGLFVAAILLFKQDFGPLLITYAACLSSYWLALMVTR